MRVSFPRIALTGAWLALVAALALAFGLAHHESQAEQVTTAMGVDADPTGNEAASLANIDACVSVAAGQTFDVDVFVTDVADLKGWQANLAYEPSVLRIVEADVELFLSGAERGRLLNISEALPDEDGSYSLAAADMTPGTSHDGSGVMARVKLEALAAGTSFLTLEEIILGDSTAAAIGDVDSNGWFDGSVGYAQVWVGEPCPGGALPTPPPGPSPTLGPATTPATTPVTPLTASPSPATVEPSASPVTPAPGATTPADGVPSEGEDNGGFPWAAVAAGAGAAVLAAVVGGLALRWFLGRG